MGMSTVIESQFHVLAVDDSLVDRKLIERMLKTKSFQVTTVDSGSKALEFLGIHENDQNNLLCQSVSPSHKQEVQVNLVITDYCMPGMTGYDLLKKIKESSSMRDIPVVIMSSENVPSRIGRCLEEGAEEFFLKPVGLADLNKLRQLMETSMKVQKQEKQGKQEQHEVDLQTIDSQLQQLQQEQVPKLEHQAELKLQQLHQEQLPQLKHQEESKLQQLQQEQVPKLEHQAELKLQQLHQEQLPQLKHQEESKLQQSEQEQPLPQEQEPTTPDNKRKTVEDGLPPERARPRYEYDGLITMV